MKTLPFSHRLKKEREKAGLSQNELARKSGLMQSAISMLEAGQREPTLDTLKKLCISLEISPEKFF